ncbi:hypothetical protein Dalu01_01676 [Deinococcus aluminii]|uniref:Uncharacterized protein n=1 Tax=Deinococcus aluminii TaxID=1656885 RepID=A0ABP9XD14_9DEIO
MDGGFGYLVLLLVAPLFLSWLFACLMLPLAAVQALVEREGPARWALWRLLSAYAFLVFVPLATVLIGLRATSGRPGRIEDLAFGLTFPLALAGVVGVLLVSTQVSRLPRSPQRWRWWPRIGTTAIASTPALSLVLLVGGAYIQARWPIPDRALYGTWVSAVKHEDYQFRVVLEPDGTYRWMAREVNGKLVRDTKGQYSFDTHTHRISFDPQKAGEPGFSTSVEVNSIFVPKLSIPMSESQWLIKEERVDHR